MSVEPRSIWLLRHIFFVQLIAGVGMLGVGVFIVPTIPHVLLDALLSPDELRDDALRGKTLSILQRSNSFHTTAWIIAGVLVVGTSMVGRRLTRAPVTLTTTE